VYCHNRESAGLKVIFQVTGAWTISRRIQSVRCPQSSICNSRVVSMWVVWSDDGLAHSANSDWQPSADDIFWFVKRIRVKCIQLYVVCPSLSYYLRMDLWICIRWRLQWGKGSGRKCAPPTWALLRRGFSLKGTILRVHLVTFTFTLLESERWYGVRKRRTP